MSSLPDMMYTQFLSKSYAFGYDGEVINPFLAVKWPPHLPSNVNS